MAKAGDTGRKRQVRNGGFSLVEMAVVVVLMGIFLTLGMAAFNAQVGNAAPSTTKKKQEIIRDALIAYLRDYKHLPCPEVTAFGGNTPTGIEGRQTTGNPATNCVSFWGTIPYAELGLPRDVAMDGYENLFTYFVSSALSGEPDWTLTQTAGVPGFSVGNPGRFAITENGVETTFSRNLAAVVIVSHGSNGLGAFTSKGKRIPLPALGTWERQNAPDTPASPPSWIAPSQTPVNSSVMPNPGIRALIVNDRKDDDGTDTHAPFDDVLMVLRPNDLLMPLIKDGALKSAEALIQEQLVTVRDTAIVQMLATACTPVAGIANLPTDPWGTPIHYKGVSNAPKLTASATATLANTTAFQIWSAGPDRISSTPTPGKGDDQTLTSLTTNPADVTNPADITYGLVSARIPTTACPDPPP